MLKPVAYSSIECLEARIAPAAVFVSATTATYTDAEGDTVAVKFTKPILTTGTSGNVMTILQVTNGNLEIDLTSLGAKAKSVGISVEAEATVASGSVASDGLVNVSEINAVGIDLGAVTIGGDLGVINAGVNSGNANTSTPGVARLSVYSMGRLEPQGGNGDLVSTIYGPLGSLSVTGVFNGESLNVMGGLTSGNIGSVTIGGSIIGGSSDYSGCIISNGNIGPVKIGGNLIGGADTKESGAIDATGAIASVTIGGSIMGASGNESGVIIAGAAIKTVAVARDLLGGSGDTSGVIEGLGLGNVTINGEVTGNTGNDSGEITSTNNGIGSVKIGLDLTGGASSGNVNSGIINSAAGITSVTIGGSVTGGASSYSGAILAQDGNIGAISIARDLVGGGTDNTTSVSGVIWSMTGSIAKISVGGSAIGGQSPSLSGAILAGVSLGPITIGGSVSGAAPTNPFLIQASGSVLTKASANLAISSVTVGGDVTNTEILAGFEVNNQLGDNNSMPVSGHVQIGAITVGGNWNASSVSAGIAPDTNGYFGTPEDTQNSGGPSNIVAKIASITIDGVFNETASLTSEYFGFVADQIGSFKFAGIVVPLTPGKAETVSLPPGNGGYVTIEVF